jgi:hypothetical protein
MKAGPTFELLGDAGLLADGVEGVQVIEAKATAE